MENTLIDHLFKNAYNARKMEVPGLVKCPDGVFNHLLRVREYKEKVLESSYSVSLIRNH